ncbi:MAG: 50S ribosomal protein L11 methyltransferase, partial [Deltaproteobacteria bacterium]|nr:50S ribosomal protein L11 methyltransferase [Deltaproteobacteria bacterium]
MTPQKPPLREDSRPVDPDSYWQLRLWIPRESEELWTMHCLDRGALGAQCHQEQETALEMGYFFGEAPPWTAQELAGEFQTLYPHLKGPESMELLRLPTERWELSWREHFAPLEVGRRLIIRPPWDASAQDAQDRLSIIINPGQGFGTGRHQTTALVLGLLEWWLERRPELPSQMLDVGAGSGVLALAACRMGVPRATLLDIDPAVAPEIQGNFALNGMAARA